MQYNDIRVDSSYFMIYKCMYFALRFSIRKFPVRNSGSQSLTERLTLLMMGLGWVGWDFGPWIKDPL